MIRQVKEDGTKHGFTIKTIPKQGYKLEVLNQQAFANYYETFEDYYVGGKPLRIPKILYFLLQQDDYIAIHKIAEWIGVSRNTVLSDLDILDEYLLPLDLNLETRSHYGVRIAGDEQSLRHAFTKYVINSHEYTSMTQMYFSFINTLNVESLREYVKQLFSDNNVIITVNAMDSIIDHIKILLFRVHNHNYIQILQQGDLKIASEYLDIARKIVWWIESEQGIRLPEVEVDYLASQIAGRTSLSTIPARDEYKIREHIQELLTEMDAEFLTDFRYDDILKEALLMHMYPLLTRISHQIKFSNPLIDFVSSRYANVFLVSMRFIELWNKTNPLDISEDEIGYLALHFAGNIERRKKRVLDSYRNILVISHLGRGNVFLIRHKLSTIFPYSNIAVKSCTSLEDVDTSDVDLIVSTIQFNVQAASDETPVVYIQEMIGDEDLNYIKEVLIAKSTIDVNIYERNIIPKLLNPLFFKRIEKGDYLEEISMMAEAMVAAGYADPDFPALVIDRELKFTTLYGNGVAGPHSLVLNAVQEAVGVIVSKQDMQYQNKSVRLIFLLNISKGNLFLYREISRFILAVMNNHDLIQKLTHASDFDTFVDVVKLVEY